MKNRVLIFAILASLSCAAPRYRYDFGKPTHKISSESTGEGFVKPSAEPETALLPTGYSDLTAGNTKQLTTKQVQRLYQVKPVPRYDAPLAQVQAPPPAASGKIDADLKRSVIFLASGAVALIIGGDVFVVAGGLSLLIGLIFGIKWLLHE